MKMPVKPIVFLHPGIPDYAGDGLFHGLRMLLGNEVIDYPRMDYMYTDYPPERWKGVGNGGKILYGLLKDNQVLQKHREKIDDAIRNSQTIIISQPNGFGKEIVPLMNGIKHCNAWQKIVWVDGSDVPAVFPFISFRRTLREFPTTILWPMHRWLYFKREYAGKQHMAPSVLPAVLKKYRIQPLSISIPEEHIENISIDHKRKDFPGYVVDEGLAKLEKLHHGSLGAQSFLFNDELSYLQDICDSRFGITTKRSGWDALRHYEYAAKSAILCFKQLNEKPASSAPHGLDHTNCIVYQNAKDLRERIQSLTEEERRSLQMNTYHWVKEHSTKEEAQRFLNIVHQQSPFLS